MTGRTALSDGKRTPLSLTGTLVSGTTIRLNPLKDENGNGEVQLTNSQGTLTLRNKNGRPIDSKGWTESSIGEVIVVFTP